MGKVIAYSVNELDSAMERMARAAILPRIKAKGYGIIMTRFQSNSDVWVQDGKSAAQAGRTGDALSAILTVLGMLLDAVDVIIKNQFELRDAITNSRSGPSR